VEVQVHARAVFTYKRTAHCIFFFIIRPTRCTNLVNLFCHETLHVSDSSSVTHLEFIRCTLSNGICHTAFEQDQDGTLFHPGPARKLSTNLYDIYHCWTPDDGQRHCPKHVEFHAKNKFAKLVHLVGIIIKKFVTMHGHMNVTQKAHGMIKPSWLRSHHAVTTNKSPRPLPGVKIRKSKRQPSRR